MKVELVEFERAVIDLTLKELEACRDGISGSMGEYMGTDDYIERLLDGLEHLIDEVKNK